MRKNLNRGFTLIEMLVVIAIISILASMLSPALQNALNVSRAVVCANNLSNLGKVLFLYVNDYGDTPPYGVSGDGRGRNAPPPRDNGWYYNFTQLYFPNPAGGINPAYQCPGFPADYPTDKEGGAKELVHYAYNHRCNTQSKPVKYSPLRACRRPAGTVAFGEAQVVGVGARGQFNYDPGTKTGFTNSGIWHFPGAAKGMFVFLDGHTKDTPASGTTTESVGGNLVGKFPTSLFYVGATRTLP